jgi:hypothetical protein
MFVTVRFWLVALDHDLSAPDDVTGDVWVRDPRGNKVALWPGINFSQGKKKRTHSNGNCNN